MPQNWWESAPVVSPPPGFTGVIPGSPKQPAPLNPLDEEAKRLEIERKRQIIAKGSEDASGVAKQGEQTAAFLATNLVANTNILSKALKVDPSAAAPTWGQIAAGLLGQDVKNSILPAQRQVVENAQKLITDAALTLGTGAAYTPVQLEAYRRGFFPQVGDSPEAIAAKKASLRAALLAAREKSGSAAPQIDEAMKALGFEADPLADARVADDGSDDGKPKGKRLTQQQEEELKGFLGGNPSQDEINKWFIDHGMPGADATNYLNYLKEGGKPGFGGVDYSKVDAAAEARARALIDKQNAVRNPVTGGQMGGASSGERLLTSGMLLEGRDELAGLGNAATNILTSPFTDKPFDPVGSYQVGRDAERLRIADARKQLGYGGTALEVVGGFLSANPQGGLAPATSALSTIKQGARTGAGVGALAGFLSGEGTEDSVNKAVLGGSIGGVLGGSVSGVSTRLAGRQGLDPALAKASEAEGVDLIKPMVDPSTISDFGALESNVHSQGIIRGATARVRGQIEDRAEGLGGGGTPLDTEAAGGRIQQGARDFITRSKGVADRLYTRARSLSGDARVEPKQALAQLDQEAAQLGENPQTNAGEIKFLEGLKSDLAEPGGKTVDGLRSLRQSLRGRINEQNLTSTQAEARAMRILDAAQQDVAASLPEGAASAFKRADSYYRERMTHIDDVIGRFLGPKDHPVSGEQAFARLKSMTSPGGDGRRLAALMRNMDGNERQDVAATIAQSLGRRAPDEPFSTALFVSQTRKLSPSARRTIFGPDGAQSIDNLRLLSQKLEMAESNINRSRSATVLERQGIRQAARSIIGQISGIGMVGAATGAVGGVRAGVAGAAVAGAAMMGSATRRVLSARAMVNPRVSRWLAQSADVDTPAKAQEAVRRLGTIISREPALAGELTPLQRSLEQALRPVAASDEAQPEDQPGQ